MFKQIIDSKIAYLTIFFLLFFNFTVYGKTVLFEDNFNEGMSSEWVSKAPSQWVSEGWLHSKDTDGWPRDSMAVVHDSDPSWQNYTLSLTADFVPESPWQRICVLAKTDNYLRTSAGTSGSAYQLTLFGPDYPENIGKTPFLIFNRIDSDADTQIELVRLEWPLTTSPMFVELSFIDDRIVLSIDEQFAFDIIDPDPLIYGGVGIHAVWESEARFDDIKVTSENDNQEALALELIAELPDVNHIQAIHIRDEAPDEIIIATENMGAGCGGGTAASIWKASIQPLTGESTALTKIQNLSKIQNVRYSLVESSDGTLFTGGGWCGYKPSYYSTDGGETWSSADAGMVYPPNSTFSFTEFNGQVYAGTGYDPYPGEIYRWLGDGRWEHVFTFPSPARCIVYTMQVYNERLFAGSWVYGWNNSTCSGSSGIYVSSDGVNFLATQGIPSCYSVFHILEVEDQLIAWVQDYYSGEKYVYLWNNDSWEELGFIGLQLNIGFRPVVYSNYAIYAYGQVSENSPRGIHQSDDFGLTWQFVAPFAEVEISALHIYDDVLYAGTYHDSNQMAFLYKLELGEHNPNDEPSDDSHKWQCKKRFFRKLYYKAKMRRKKLDMWRKYIREVKRKVYYYHLHHERK